MSQSPSRVAAFTIGAALVAISAVAQQAQPRPPSGLCVDDDLTKCAVAAEPEPTKHIKWHPGHYMLTNVGSPQSDLDDLINEPTVKGAQIRYRWVDLEPKKGIYDFSRIESDLKRLQSMPTPKRLVAQVLDIEFNTTDPRGIIPDYLLDEPEYNGGVAQTINGYSARLWEKQSMDRLIALHEAIGRRFNNEPYFEAIATRETSPSFSTTPGIPAGYTQSGYATQYKRLISAIRVGWPNTNVFVYTNYLVGELEGIVAHAHENLAGAGGPDVTPNHPSAGARIILGIDGDIVYKGKMPIAFAVQTPELCGKEGCNLPKDIYNFAVDTLGVNYLFWIRFGTAKDTSTEKYSWRDGILPVIRANNGRINTPCPTAFNGICMVN